METWELKDYQKQVRRCLDEYRIRCFGLRTPISAILPGAASDYSDEEKAELIARQILFQAASCSEDCTAEDAERAWQWVYTITRYLFKECNPDDQTFYGFERLLSSKKEIRAILFQKPWALPAIREDNQSPPLLQDPTSVFLGLLNERGLLVNSHSFFNQLAYFSDK